MNGLPCLVGFTFQEGAYSLGGNYTQLALKRVSLSLDERVKALQKLYPTYVDR